MKIYITAMTRNRAEVKSKLGAHMDLIFQHLLCLILTESQTYRDHWMNEIHAFLNTVDKLRMTNKFPTEDQIYEWTYGESRDLVLDDKYFGSLLEEVCEKEKFQIPQDRKSVMTELDLISQEYFKWVAEVLSDRGRIQSSEVHEKLNSLL